jgi:hypothetical protein
MATPAKTTMTASCACGSVELEAAGAPIASVVCYCDDCQEGARRIEALPGAAAVLDPGGGSAYIVYRSDRFRCAKGAEQLKSYKVKDSSPTKRVVAACCNSAMYLGFDDSKHWVSAYRARFHGDLPPLQIRVCTKFAGEDVKALDDVPNHPGFAPGFMLKLLGARVAMLFGR